MNSESSVSLVLNSFRAFPETQGFGPESLFEVLIGGSEYIFYTAGSNNETLYAYDILSGASAPVYTASSQITALRPGVVSVPSSFAAYAKTNDLDRLLLGTTSGTLALLDISEAKIAEGAAPELASFSGLGKVVDMDFYVAKNPYCYFGF